MGLLDTKIAMEGVSNEEPKSSPPSPSDVVNAICAQFVAAVEAPQLCAVTEKTLGDFILAKAEAWNLTADTQRGLCKVFGMALAHPQANYGAKDIEIG